jgi:hypothetical protein
MVEEGGSFADLIERLQELSESNPASILVELARKEVAVDGDGVAVEPASERMRVAAKAIEEHETELVDRLLDLLYEEMPEGATHEQGLASIDRTLDEHPEAQELTERLTLMAIFGGKVAQRAMHGPFEDAG